MAAAEGITGVIDLLNRVVEVVEKPKKVLFAVLKAFDQRVRGTFRTETDPWGIAWPALKPSTLANRRAKGNGSLTILNDEAVMFRSFDVRMLSETQGEFSIGGANRFPVVHQFGNPSNLAWGGPSAPIPARPMFPARARDAEMDLPDPWLDDMLKPMNDAIEKAIKP